MSDFVRVFLIAICMYTCFLLGKHYAMHKACKAVLDGIQEALNEFKKQMKDQIIPNEMLLDKSQK